MSQYDDEMEVVTLQDLLDDARYAEAEQLLRLIEADGEPWAPSLRALCLAELEQPDEAMAAAERGVALDPSASFAHWVVGALRVDRNHLKEAEAAAREALRLDSGDAANWSLLAQVHAKRGQWSECLSASEEGLARDPASEACANLRALALRATTSTGEWKVELEKLTTQYPASAWARAGSGWGHLATGHAAEARASFEQALALDPTSAWARDGLIEAIKAQNPVYSALLQFFMWLNRLPARTRWTIILGGLFGYRVLRTWARANPELAPLAYPFMAAWVLFIAASWTSGPLSDFILSRTRVGKDLIRGVDLVAANLVAGLLVLAVGLGIAAWVTDLERALFGAMAFGFLIIPVAAVFTAPEGWPRRVMGVYASVTALFAGAALLAPPDVGEGALVVAILMAVLGSWVGTFLASRTVRA